MATGYLGTFASDSLAALPAWSQVLSEADVSAIGQNITSDTNIAALLGTFGPGPTAVLATASMHTNTTVDSLVYVAGAALAQIQVGDLVIGGTIRPGTFVAAKPTATSVTITKAATTTNTGLNVGFVRVGQPGLGRAGQLLIPNRGILKVLPGDIVAVDSLGWPILVSAASINTAGTQWVVT